MLLEPVPAITGTLPFTLFTLYFMISYFSSSVRVALSPVVPLIMIASVLFFIWYSNNSPNFSKSTLSSFVNGVIKATP